MKLPSKFFFNGIGFAIVSNEVRYKKITEKKKISTGIKILIFFFIELFNRLE